MDPYLHIRELEKQICEDAELASRLEGYIKDGCSPDEHHLIVQQIAQIDERLLTAQAELAAIERNIPRRIKIIEVEVCVRELNKKRRRRHYPTLVPRPLVNFYGLDVVADRALVAA